MTEEKVVEKQIEEELDPREVKMMEEHSDKTEEEVVEKVEEDFVAEKVEKPAEVLAPVKEVVVEGKEAILGKLEKGEELTEEEEAKINNKDDFSFQEKKMYFKYKGEKQKRQTEASKRELAEIKFNASQQRIKELEEQNEKIKNGELEDDNDEFITKAEAIRIAEEKYQARIREQNSKELTVEQAQANFTRSKLDEVVYNEMAKDTNFIQKQNKFLELIDKDSTLMNEFQERASKLGSSVYAEDDLINLINRSVERSGFKVETISNDNDKDKTNRMIENSTKQPNAVSVGASSGAVKTIEEFEFVDIANMSDEEYSKLPEEKREYLLKKLG